MTLAQDMAERIVAMRADNLPQAALDWSKVGVMDTLEVTLAGVKEDAPSTVAELIGANIGHGAAGGEALVLGSAGRTSALDAALINGVAAHVLDYDNGGANMGGHASAVMVPALLAAAEAHGCSGLDVLVAHTAGFETGSQLGRAVHPMRMGSTAPASFTPSACSKPGAIRWTSSSPAPPTSSIPAATARTPRWKRH